MKTYRRNPRFISKPSARVSAMARKYGTLEIPIKGEDSPYGENLVADGYGNFETNDTESWAITANNTGVVVDNALRITYVDQFNGGEVYLYSGVGGDLKEDTVDGKTYVTICRVRQFSGTGCDIRVAGVEVTATAPIAGSDYETIILEWVKKPGVNPFLNLRDYGSGDITDLDWYEVREVL